MRHVEDQISPSWNQLLNKGLFHINYSIELLFEPTCSQCQFHKEKLVGFFWVSEVICHIWLETIGCYFVSLVQTVSLGLEL